MVNAILRKFAALPRPRKPIVESAEAMATRLGHPAWIVRRWERTYDRAAAEAICGRVMAVMPNNADPIGIEPSASDGGAAKLVPAPFCFLPNTRSAPVARPIVP